MSNQDNTKEVFPQKYLKKLNDLPDFLDSVNGMSEEDIKKKILISEGAIYDTDIAKAADTELIKAKEVAKEIAAPYRETKALETAKIQYYIYTLEQRGISL